MVLSLLMLLLIIEYLRLHWLCCESLILDLCWELEMWLLKFMSFSSMMSSSSWIFFSLELISRVRDSLSFSF